MKEYKNLLIDAGLFFYAGKGDLILPPRGWALWKNIQKILDEIWILRGIQNVSLPTLIPSELLAKEQEHIKGFNPECYYVDRAGDKKLNSTLVLRPTSEVLFYEWYAKTLYSYKQLPFLHNQWCTVFRAEASTYPFLRNREFHWQEGHTIHENEIEAKDFLKKIISDYQYYAEKILNLAVIVGRKSEGEKFAGALKSYTVEHLLLDGQCLQLATGHYFGDNFCRLMKVKFQNSKNNIEYPFSTSWGTSTRAIGAIAKTHNDELGIIMPFKIAPVQIAFILKDDDVNLFEYYKKIYQLLKNDYRCELFKKEKWSGMNIVQADKEGCPFKIVLGAEEMLKKTITLIKRNKIDEKKKICILNEKYVLSKKKIKKLIENEIKTYQIDLYQKNVIFRDSHVFLINNYLELVKQIESGIKGLFLIAFCEQKKCEEETKKRITSYTIRCIALNKKVKKEERCIFCQMEAKCMAYFGRSY